MKIFLSYASQDRAIAEAINRALLDDGYDVFFDRDDLPPGEEFNIRIRRAIETTDLFVLLVSADAIDPGSYTLNEVEIAERAFRRASGRFLPVLLRPMPLDSLPPFVKSVTLLQSSGNITAATAEAVHRLALDRRRTLWTRVASGLAAAALLAVGTLLLRPPVSAPSTDASAVPASAPASTAATSLAAASSATVGDSAPEVLVPAGAFVMGDDEESPRRQVFVDAYHIDRFEITTGRYAKFLAATGSVHAPEGWETLALARGDQLPVVGVDWNDATAYCTWAGRRLPTETEWEKAARGTDQRSYPWGNNSPTPMLANYENSSPEAYDGGLAKVGSHPAGASPYGVQDMAGNVSEWMADWFSESFPRSDVRNPKGPSSGNGHVIRGGGRFDPGHLLLSTKRYHGEPELRAQDIGFRCARNP